MHAKMYALDPRYNTLFYRVPIKLRLRFIWLNEHKTLTQIFIQYGQAKH